MKLNLFLIFFIIFLAGCAQKEIKKEITILEPEKETIVIKEQTVEKPAEQIAVGWSDKDTYTVKVTAENLEKAKEKAKHKILQDIVKIRMFNESRFTDITKINSEFENPIKNGKILSEKKVENNVEIYYQITDEGLKQKFEKK